MKRLVAEHGTISMYTNQRCRCTDCRAAFATYAREHKKIKPVDKAAKKVWNRKYYENHKEKWVEKREKQKDYNREYCKQWRQANKTRVNELSRESKARRRAVHYIKFTQSELAQKMSMWAGCWMCGGEKEQIDHVKPVSKGGWHILANLRPACADCNLRKSNKWPLPQDLVKLRIK